MEQKVCPIDVISICSACGEIRPLRLRLEDEDYGLLRADVDEVISIKHIRYVGVEAQVFVCRVSVDGRKRIMELRYSIRSHSWSLMRTVC